MKELAEIMHTIVTIMMDPKWYWNKGNGARKDLNLALDIQILCEEV